MSFEQTLLAIIIVPVLGSLCSFIAGRYHSIASAWIATACSALSFILVLKSLPALYGSGAAPVILQSEPWFVIGTLSVKWSLVFDQLSAVMCLLITGVGTLIHIFSVGYMAEDPGKPRFFSYLNLFLASMLILVLGGNLPVMFVGWEGVGLCSYLLIGFWFSNSSYSFAAQKAFVINRIADLGLLLCMFIIFYNFNTLEIADVLDSVRSSSYSNELLMIIGLLLLVGAFGKSAQFPFFTWLPDAMAGPTPVSALIHAATMVTAGIYLLARMNPFLEAVPELKLILATVATFTAFISATSALVQQDIKKVLAYSTVSQLGFMFVAVSCGAYWIAIFHVVTHGFFKACLFLSAGSVIHGCHHEQNMTRMGGLARMMPVTFCCFTMASIAIAGIAPFAGYYSKHAILESFGQYASSQASGLLPYLSTLISVTSVLTAFYISRCWTMTFLGSYRGAPGHKPHEVSVVMLVPVVILAILSVFAGWYLQTPIAEFLSHVIPAAPVPHASAFFDYQALMHSLPGIAGVVAALVLYRYMPALLSSAANFTSPLNALFKSAYFIDELFDLLLIKPLRLIGWCCWKLGDQLFLEGIIRSGVALTRIGGGMFAFLQSGQVRHYAGLFFAGLIGLVYLLLLGI